MLATQIVRISFGKRGAVWVSWKEKDGRGKKKRFGPEDVKQAISFACGLRQEERDKPLILLPANAFNSLIDIFNDPEWERAVKTAR